MNWKHGESFLVNYSSISYSFPSVMLSALVQTLKEICFNVLIEKLHKWAQHHVLTHTLCINLFWIFNSKDFSPVHQSLFVNCSISTNVLTLFTRLSHILTTMLVFYQLSLGSGHVPSLLFPRANSCVTYCSAVITGLGDLLVLLLINHHFSNNCPINSNHQLW